MIDAIISSVPNAVHLDLSNTPCTSNNMLCIQRMCPLLVSLDVQYCKIRCEELRLQCGTHEQIAHESLRQLNLNGNGIKYFDLFIVFKMFPLLEQLKTEGMAYQLYEAYATVSPDMNIRFNLKELIYNAGPVLKILHAWTILCPYVTRISLYPDVTQEEIDMCSRFEYLEVLEIKPGFIRDRMDDPEWRKSMNYGTANVLSPFIPKGKRFIKLQLTSVEISIKALIECFGNLKTLYLEHVRFTDFLEDDLTLQDNKLEVLVLKEMPFDIPATCRAILSLVSVSQNVTALHLIKNKVPQNVCDAILNSMKNLSYVRFAGFELPGSIQRFLEIPSLEIYVDDEWREWDATSWSTKFGFPFPFPPCYEDSNSLSWCHKHVSEGEDSDYSYKTNFDYYDSEDSIDYYDL